MKKPLFKSIVLLSAALAIFSCSDEATDAINQAKEALADANQPSAEEYAWLLDAGQPILVYPSGIVTDANGTVIGTFVPAAEGSTVGNIVAVDGNNIVENVDTSLLQVTTRGEVNTPAVPASSASLPGVSSETQNLPGVSSASLPAVSSASVPAQSSNSTATPSSNSQPQTTSSAAQQQTQSSAATSNTQCNDQCFDKASGKCVKYYAEQTGSKGEKYAYDNSCNVKCYYDPDNKDCKNISGSAPASSSSQQQQQQQKSSSSQQQQQVSTNFKIKSGGRSGQGWGSRYWDCCMPHCAWKGNTSNPTKTCDANMNSIGESGGSVCSGGSGGVCDMQAPWAANEKLAFAFAAVPAALGGECGKCFLLTFDGKSHNGGNKANTSGLSGKQMVIMVSNIGGDVSSNQFDIMIPGGGVGLYNGCGAQLGIPSTGAQYGGFITDCKSDPSCVKQKCSVFSKYPKLQAGCEFSATWMGGANNPSFKFEELESCPSEISSKW